MLLNVLLYFRWTWPLRLVEEVIYSKVYIKVITLGKNKDIK